LCTRKTINRIRSGVERTEENLYKWILTADADCECGSVQTSKHLIDCSVVPIKGKKEDFLGRYLSYNAIIFAYFWAKKGI
jgi:hypothetical protein